jgi:hypothetical protein
MAVPVQLGISFSPAEITAMKGGLQVVIDTVKSKIEMNLSNEERQALNSVKDERRPYIDRSVTDYAVTYPNLNGLGYSAANATRDHEVLVLTDGLATLTAEVNERLEELNLLAGHFCFKFMSDQYNNASRYKDDNVPGAQIVYDGLKGCFEGQGPQNPTPPAP